ncbi:MAG TPA: hypothetical protein VEI95_08705, partial [Acidobacteriota bacterium]|nr:hypothetical protein [Acidobacteriota bacterium]
MENTAAGQLHGFFHQSVRQSFWQLGIHDATVTGYVADVLTEFARSENLYKVRAVKGRKIDSMVEMLSQQETPRLADENDVLRERTRRKYLGDYALFMSGIFRQYVEGKGSL